MEKTTILSTPNGPENDRPATMRHIVSLRDELQHLREQQAKMVLKIRELEAEIKSTDLHPNPRTPGRRKVDHQLRMYDGTNIKPNKIP